MNGKLNAAECLTNFFGNPKPFVKWAGGKRQIVDILLKNVPKRFDTYFEPFVGGGALLFALLPKRAVIGDINRELINAYCMIRDNVEALIEDLRKHRNDEEYYYVVRSQDPAELTDVKRASRFIFLNKTCYNGLYRENKQGKFNVPFGRYKNPDIVSPENLMNVSAYLNSADIEILCQDYKLTTKIAREGDFVYLDPPYYPLSRESFTEYVQQGFSERDHEELAEVFCNLDKKGCYVLLSNSGLDIVKDLYRKFDITEIKAKRLINSKAERREIGVSEILVKNF
ncbi:MAG: DNA adenine methylase [Candidatus Hadarchaeum sp.]